MMSFPVLFFSFAGRHVDCKSCSTDCGTRWSPASAAIFRPHSWPSAKSMASTDYHEYPFRVSLAI